MSEPTIPNQEPGAPEPVLQVGDHARDVADLLMWLRRVVGAHPQAARAAIAALVAEGRSYAQTPAGADWKRRLEQSPAIRNARLLWDGITEPLARQPTQAPASAILSDVLTAASLVPGEAVLARMLFGDTSGSR